LPQRFDVGAVSGVERLDNGFLRADAKISRAGVFQYRKSDGSTRRELRLPAEVFHADSIHSFQLSPLTNGHPGEAITSRNASKYRTGVVTHVRADAPFVSARVQVEDESAISAVDGGKRELSCGYTCDLDDTPGVTSGIAGVPDGLRYDAIQRKIRGNHVALVAKGRAGPDVALRLDSDAIQIDEPTPGPEPKDIPTMALVKIKHDGVDVEITEAGAQVVSALLGRIDARNEAQEAVKVEISKLKARADKADEDLAAEKKLREDAGSPEAIDARVAERVAIVTQGKAVLGDDFKEDASDDEIKRDVVVKLSKDPEAVALKLDEQDGAYLNARYDAAVEAIPAKDPGKAALSVVRETFRDDVDRTDSDAARDRMIEANAKLWDTSAEA